IGDAMAMSDPRAALDRLVEIFCSFWSSDAAIGRLHDAMATDPEFATALIGRNERRRKALSILVERATKNVSRRTREDAVDMIFAVTSYATFAMLRGGRSVGQTCELLKMTCNSTLDRLVDGDPGKTANN